MRSEWSTASRWICLWIASGGRMNPFKSGNLQRGRTAQYERAYPLSTAEVATLLGWLEGQQHTAAARAIMRWC